MINFRDFLRMNKDEEPKKEEPPKTDETPKKMVKFHRIYIDFKRPKKENLNEWEKQKEEKPWPYGFFHQHAKDEKYQQHLADLHDRLRNHYDETHYSMEQVEAIQHYTGDGSHRINRGEYLEGSHREKEIDRNLTDAMSVRKTPHKLQVYTGMKRSPEEKFGKVEEGETHWHAHMPSFSSATTSPAVAIHFSTTKATHDIKSKKLIHHILKIHVPEGSNGVFAHDHITSTEGEHEFILPRNSKIKIYHKPTLITRIQKSNFGPDFHKVFHIWHAKLIHDGEKEVGEGMPK